MKHNHNNIVQLALMLFAVVLFAACVGKSDRNRAFDADQQIGVISREEGSGTRQAFAENFEILRMNDKGRMIDDITETAIITNNTAVMLNTVSADRYAVGYTSLGRLNNTVKPVSINGVFPTVENVRNGRYTAVCRLSIVTLAEKSRAVDDFIGFIFSTEGQSVIRQYGYAAPDSSRNYVPGDISGKITVSGSSAVALLMEKIIEAYADVAPQVTVELQQSDSSSGIADVIDSSCDIGLSSRDLSAQEKKQGAQEMVIALDGIVVVVNKDNPLTGLSGEAVRDIFSGRITRWENIPND